MLCDDCRANRMYLRSAPLVGTPLTLKTLWPRWLQVLGWRCCRNCFGSVPWWLQGVHHKFGENSYQDNKNLWQLIGQARFKKMWKNILQEFLTCICLYSLTVFFMHTVFISFYSTCFYLLLWLVLLLASRANWISPPISQIGLQQAMLTMHRITHITRHWIIFPWLSFLTCFALVCPFHISCCHDSGSYCPVAMWIGASWKRLDRTLQGVHSSASLGSTKFDDRHLVTCGRLIWCKHQNPSIQWRSMYFSYVSSYVGSCCTTYQRPCVYIWTCR